jgi:putative hydrolase of the HAD superfamily
LTKRYKHLFFDLDHTIWDHQSNANETLEELFRDFALHELYGFSIDSFQDTFHKINHGLWHRYHLGEVDKTHIRRERFNKVLARLGVAEFADGPTLGEAYLARCPRKGHLMPNALDTLDYLKSRYPMTIITNGFAEIQDLKLSSSGLGGYFRQVVTSEKTGWLKPHQGIFDYALKQAKVSSDESIMIGDNPVTDIAGARDSGIDQIYYNSRGCDEQPESTYIISSLQDLKELL